MKSYVPSSIWFWGYHQCYQSGTRYFWTKQPHVHEMLCECGWIMSKKMNRPLSYDMINLIKLYRINMKYIPEMSGLAEVTLIKKGCHWPSLCRKKSLVLLLELKTGRCLRNAIVGAPAIPWHRFRRNKLKNGAVFKKSSVILLVIN